MHLFAIEQADLNMDNPLIREEVKKILVVCSYTEKDVPFKMPKGFDMTSAQLILYNYPTAGNTIKPYETRIYLWNK